MNAHEGVERVHLGRSDIFGTTLVAYGTLQIDAVLSTLIGRVPAKIPAQLDDWRAVQLPERPYPGLVHHAGHTARGQLLTGLSADDWMLLDRFEDRDYELLRVEVSAQPPGSMYGGRSTQTPTGVLTLSSRKSCPDT